MVSYERLGPNVIRHPLVSILIMVRVPMAKRCMRNILSPGWQRSRPGFRASLRSMVLRRVCNSKISTRNLDNSYFIQGRNIIQDWCIFRRMWWTFRFCLVWRLIYGVDFWYVHDRRVCLCLLTKARSGLQMFLRRDEW